MGKFYQNINPYQAFDGVITSDIFGANFLFNRDNVDDVNGEPGTGGTFDDVVEEIGITILRYPGGAMAEWTFELENPDAAVHNYGGLNRFQPHGNNTEHLGLTKFLDYASENGLSMNFVMPTIRFLGDETQVDENGMRYAGIGPAETKLISEFVIRLMTDALARGVPVRAIELGNEWYTDFTDMVGTSVNPIEYGRVASEIAVIVQDALDTFAAGNDLPEGWVEPDIVVQLGHAIKDPDTGRELFSETEATQAIFDQFDTPAEKAALDGTLTHRYDVASYDLIERMVNRNFGQFDVWDALAARDDAFGEMKRYVTEWNISGRSENTTGLLGASAMLELFSIMLKKSVDYANIWAVQQNNVSNLSGNEGSNDLRVTGELFKLMVSQLQGLTLLDVESDRDSYELTAFGSDDKNVLYIGSRSDEKITVELDISIFGEYAYIWGVILGVEDGENPLRPAAIPELEYLNSGDLKTGSTITVELDPYEIIQVVISKGGAGVEINGDDTSERLEGTVLDDVLRGAGGDDIIDGGNGNDILHGDDGNDTIYAGNGHDEAYGGEGNDGIQLGAGRDKAWGGAGDDYIDGRKDDDILDGGSGDDTIIGGDGNDVIYDGPGNDLVYGGAGDDTFFAGAGSDTYSGGESLRDTINFSSSHQGLVINFNDVAQNTGIAAGDQYEDIEIVVGSDYDDIIYAGAGVVEIHGAGGNDLLVDSASTSDIMSGGSGADTFRFVDDGGQRDTILDFDADQDLIDLTNQWVTDFNQLDLQNVTGADGEGVLITLQGGDSIMLLGLEVGDLSEEDFIFAGKAPICDLPSRSEVDAFILQDDATTENGFGNIFQ